MANISELNVYQNSLEFSNQIWNLCLKWNSFASNTVGYQIVKAADSISANLAEGYGRFHLKDNIHFCYYSSGSLEETKDWLRKSRTRNLISENTYQELTKEIVIIAKQLNKYITSLKKKIHRS
ncbi:MAG: four helix bundle protein [Candidatus Cloacimonetes bacterium]|nr:four helix bundle protein [Candidatus Cloacimonadota bacterium]MCF7815179.1 four helix bundle protein [Candidatus Cloacimonadota bacterium]MCF7867693.1 four helix bundle protein [Candidatus Cloacimonadota bacterium]